MTVVHTGSYLIAFKKPASPLFSPWTYVSKIGNQAAHWWVRKKDSFTYFLQSVQSTSPSSVQHSLHCCIIL